MTRLNGLFSKDRPVDSGAGRQYSIMVVDDEAQNRHMLRTLLEFDGFIVSEARDGVDALAKIQRNQPDILVLDMMMPRMDGIAVCRALRSSPDTLDIPVIILSAVTAQSVIENALDAGANTYITKPVSYPKLMENVDELLGQDVEG